MFRNSRISRPLTVLLTVMALGVSGCAGGTRESFEGDLIETIMAILYFGSSTPAPGAEEPDINLVDRRTETFSLQAGGAMQVTIKEDDSHRNLIFNNTEDSHSDVFILAEFVRSDQRDEAGLNIHFEWGPAELDPGNVFSFDQNFGPEDLDSEQNGPFKSYSRAGDKFFAVEPGEVILNLQYATFGGWSSDNADNLQTGFFFSGIPTGSASKPTTGAANYAGLTIGSLSDSENNISALEGYMTLAVNFADGSVDGDFTGMMKTADDGTVTSWRDFSMDANINTGTDNFSGTTNTNDGLLSGKAEGAFFGPGAAEVAGAWTLAGDGEIAIGSFGGGQD